MAAVSLLRGNAPRVRYWFWLAASLKFLVPFSLLVSAGGRVVMPPDAPSLHATTVTRISNYFAPMEVAVRPAPATTAIPWTTVLAAFWLAGALSVLLRWLWHWYAIRRTMRTAVNVPADLGIRVLSVPARIEPGIFGLFRPVLLVPASLMNELTPEQFDAIMAHERRHIACRDNLTAALHMCVEALVWFHPLVWWIGSRLMEERERDCDEAVLRSGSRARDYARGIVSVCRQYTESPLACTAGISGADLKKRIREIMSWRGSLPVSLRRKAVLAAAAAVAVSLPFFIGLTKAQSLPPAPQYTYEVVSIHKTPPGQTNVHIGPGPQGGLRTENTSVMVLIAFAYSIQNYQIVGAPGWASSERFDVMFTPDKTEINPGPGMDPKDFEGYVHRNGQRLQAVLRDRFGLVLRTETRELPIYGLIQAPRGNKLSLNADEKSGVPSIQTNGNRQITASNATMEMLAEQLSMELQRPVQDETGLKGRYNLKLEWAPEPDISPDHVAAGANNSLPGVSIFTAITEQLGLKLEAKKGPVPVYVVEKIERPTEN